MRNRNKIRPTVLRMSKALKDEGGNNVADQRGVNRPNTDGPIRIPPMISPMTRACPSLRASHPQKTVTSRTTVIWTSKRVIELSPSPNRNQIGDTRRDLQEFQVNNGSPIIKVRTTNL